ncbi:MAG: COX15/CtaA family protein [Myxococcota bacterium]
MASEAAARGRTRFATFCWFALAYTLAVIVWGAFVRATGSGAGCGSHWPTCNGEVVPRAPSVETLIEFSHRLTSGLSGLIVLAQVLLARRLYPRGHRVRQAAGWAGGFMLLEVIIGAGIVVLKYVADDQSVGRAVWMGVHLVSTFLLVGAMTLTAHYARGAARVRLAGTGTRGALAGVVLASIILTGLSGSVAALGDTLFPAESLGTALAADLSPTAHFLVRLRVAHPFIAVGAAFLTLGYRAFLQDRSEGRPGVARWGLWVRVTVLSQLGLGLVNVMLLAPVWLQLVHLFLADVLWISLVLFIAHAFAGAPVPGRVAPDAGAATSVPGPRREDGRGGALDVGTLDEAEPAE